MTPFKSLSILFLAGLNTQARHCVENDHILLGNSPSGALYHSAHSEDTVAPSASREGSRGSPPNGVTSALSPSSPLTNMGHSEDGCGKTRSPDSSQMPPGLRLKICPEVPSEGSCQVTAFSTALTCAAHKREDNFLCVRGR